VKGGQLGEIGVDGAFHDDGEFHPLPADALPDNPVLPSSATTNETMSCVLSGQSVVVAKVGVLRSASAKIPLGAHARHRVDALPRSDFRDVYFGLLGPRAVSVSYGQSGEGRTQRVVPGIGAYLIVQRSAEGQPRESGGGELAGSGLLAPEPREPLKKFTYRVHGRLCEEGLKWVRGREGVWRSEGDARDVAHPCPAVGGQGAHEAPARTRRLHVPLHVRVHLTKDVVSGLTVSFKAPYAINSARAGYSVLLPQVACHSAPEREELGGTGFPLSHDVRRGGTVSAFIAYPFRVNHICGKKEVEIDILYSGYERGLTIVGSATVKQPPGTRNGTRQGGTHRHRTVPAPNVAPPPPGEPRL